MHFLYTSHISSGSTLCEFALEYRGLGSGVIAKCNCTVKFIQSPHNFFILLFILFFLLLLFFIFNSWDLKLLPYQLHQVQYPRYCTWSQSRIEVFVTRWRQFVKTLEPSRNDYILLRQNRRGRVCLHSNWHKYNIHHILSSTQFSSC